MNDVLKTRENDCRSCYKCIRACPSKSISFQNGQARIIPSECVLCGTCYEVCPQHCKIIRDDTSLAYRLLSSGEAYASIAPSFLSSFPGVSFSSLKQALLRLGFKDAEETAMGAKLVKDDYERLIEMGQDVVISTCCHAVNLLVQKHYPECLPYMAATLSPMQAHGYAIKEAHKGAKVIFIGPCIAKKDEADNYPGSIDCVLTFLELGKMLEEKGIVPEQKEEPVLERSATRLFPMEGGVLRSMKQKEGVDYVSISGIDNCLLALEDIKRGKIHHAFIEMSSCPGSCLNGPAHIKKENTALANLLSLRHSAGPLDFEVAPLQGKMDKSFADLANNEPLPSEEQIAAVLSSIGKVDKKDELNCSSCGYPSCREKAIAVLQGKASLEMCLPFLMEKATSFGSDIVEYSPNGIVVLNEDGIIQLSNPAMASLVGVGSPKALIGKSIAAYLDPEPFFTSLSGLSCRKKKMALNNGKIGEVSIYYDEKYHIIISSIRDVTDHELRKAKHIKDAEETARVTSLVIDKNMEAVQQIAQLLGESAAATKIALTKLSDTLADRKGKEEDEPK
jgi:iron only hydrogenase large subunit-like protein